jgi:glutaredoxin
MVVKFLPVGTERVLKMFVETNCPSCRALKTFLSAANIKYVESNIDVSENKVDALMLNIYSVPALVIENRVLKASQIFDSNNSLRKNDIMEFVRRD